MKIWCEHCEGTGTVTNALCLGSGIRGIGAVQSERCNKCEGKGYTDPPQQILDDLECAEIEREIIKHGYMTIYSESKDGVCELGVKFSNSSMYFVDTSKLAVYRKSKEWIEGRG